MNLLEQCQLCHQQGYKIMPRYSDNYLARCPQCSLVFSSRNPSQKELDEYYGNYGSSHYLSPITIKRYQELLEFFEPYRKNNKVFDVGCGRGFFLEEARKKGWEVYGSEYSEHLIHECKTKGIKMHQGDIINYEHQNEFDIITSFEVLEHTLTPDEQMKTINKMLRQGGAVYLTTPNFKSLLRYKLKEKYNIICYPEHLTYFTRRSLHYLMKKNEFKKKYLHTKGISLTRLRTSQGKSKQKVVSQTSNDEQIRVDIEKSNFKKSLKNIANGFLSMLGVGDSLKAFYEKK